MSRRFQFSLGRLFAATALVGVGLASLRFTAVMPYEWAPWAQVTAFQVCMLSAGVSFGVAVGMFLNRTIVGAVLGMLCFTAGGWAVIIVT